MEPLCLIFKAFFTLRRLRAGSFCPAQTLGNLARQMFRVLTRIAEQAFVRRGARFEQTPLRRQRPPDDPQFLAVEVKKHRPYSREHGR